MSLRRRTARLVNGLLSSVIRCYASSCVVDGILSFTGAALLRMARSYIRSNALCRHAMPDATVVRHGIVHVIVAVHTRERMRRMSRQYTTTARYRAHTIYAITRQYIIV